MDFIEATVPIFRRYTTNALFITGDKCSTNKNLAVLLGVPLVGYRSQRFNLAVNTFLEDYSVILGRVSNLMEKLSTLKRRGSLRLDTAGTYYQKCYTLLFDIHHDETISGTE